MVGLVWALGVKGKGGSGGNLQTCCSLVTFGLLDIEARKLVKLAQPVASSYQLQYDGEW